MGVDVKLTLHPVQLGAAIDRGLLAGGQAVLGISDGLAPREPEPRHGEHLTETGFVRINVDGGDRIAEIGYRAFWAIWQNEDLDYEHPHGGQAKFLDTACVEGAGAAFEALAAHVRAGLAGA